MSLKQFWYIACRSKELQKKPLKISILSVDFALFRDELQAPVAILDRCLHRNAQLSQGWVKEGCLSCPYHGWVYQKDGQVIDIPAHKSKGHSRQQTFPVKEQEGYIYVWLGDTPPTADEKPFAIPKWGIKGYHHLSLTNLFENTVTNCCENFLDIPHTVFVHPGIFRVKRNQKILARVVREQGRVSASYSNETDNLGFFSKFLNPKAKEILHHDHFYMPNVTCVEYFVEPRRHFFITSQSIPIASRQTLVYTDLTYNYGMMSRLAAPLIRSQAQKIISQDQVILKNQNTNLVKYGEAFQNSPSDQLHIYLESIRRALERGEDPKAMPRKEKEIEFWV